MAKPESQIPTTETPAVEAIRRFNRFHTRWVGALGGSLHGSGFALTEARVLYELAQRDGWLASELARDLGLDPAYLSRILKRFTGAGWLARERSSRDGRALRLVLTPAGRAAFAPLDQASREQAQAILRRLAPGEQGRLVAALGQAQALLAGGASTIAEPLIREHRPGDIGWVVATHGRLYAQDYGWDISFEALVAEIAAKFLRGFGRVWSAASSRSGVESRSAAPSSSARAKARPSSGWSSSRPRREGSASESGWSRKRSNSLERPAMPASCSGPTTSCMRHAPSMSLRVFALLRRSAIIPSDRIWSGRTGNWGSDMRKPAASLRRPFRPEGRSIEIS